MQEKKKERKNRPEDRKVFSRLCLTFPPPRAIISKQAGVLELADEEDSKSFGLITRAGSTPATGTNRRGRPVWDALFCWCRRRSASNPPNLHRGAVQIPSSRHPIKSPLLLFRARTAGSALRGSARRPPPSELCRSPPRSASNPSDSGTCKSGSFRSITKNPARFAPGPVNDSPYSSGVGVGISISGMLNEIEVQRTRSYSD